jgi:hypothetical protein
LGSAHGGTGISVLPGQGDGSFGRPLATGTPTNNALVAGDFDGAGHADIACAAANIMGVQLFVCDWDSRPLYRVVLLARAGPRRAVRHRRA